MVSACGRPSSLLLALRSRAASGRRLVVVPALRPVPAALARLGTKTFVAIVLLGSLGGPHHRRRLTPRSSGPAFGRPLSSNVRPLMPEHAVCLAVARRRPELPRSRRSAACTSSVSSPRVLRVGCPSSGGQRTAEAARDDVKTVACRCAERRLGLRQRSRYVGAGVGRHAAAQACEQHRTLCHRSLAPVQSLAHHRGATHSQGHK